MVNTKLCGLDFKRLALISIATGVSMVLASLFSVRFLLNDLIWTPLIVVVIGITVVGLGNPRCQDCSAQVGGLFGYCPDCASRLHRTLCGLTAASLFLFATFAFEILFVVIIAADYANSVPGLSYLYHFYWENTHFAMPAALVFFTPLIVFGGSLIATLLRFVSKKKYYE